MAIGAAELHRRLAVGVLRTLVALDAADAFARNVPVRLPRQVDPGQLSGIGNASELIGRAAGFE